MLSSNHPKPYRRLTSPVYALAILIASTSFLSGCSSHSDDPTTYPVTGQVTLDGSPAAGAVVTFSPKSGGEATAAQTTTDAEGKFDVQVFLDGGKRTQRGLMPAEYRISVIQLEKPSGQSLRITSSRNLLPKKYASEQTSGLETTVSADGKNELLLELSK